MREKENPIIIRSEKSRSYDVRTFTIRDMTECGSALRRIGAGAKTMEETAVRIVRHLYDSLIDGQTDKRACSLVRFFKTHPYRELDDELQGVAGGMLGNVSPPPDMKCLVLLATTGERHEWNSRRESKGHRSIPLPSEETVRQIPMIQNLLTQMGLTVRMVLNPDRHLLLDMEQKTYNVFYVPEALCSPYIPAQEEFVVPCGIRSVLGFGGLLPGGDVFAVIMFLNISVPMEVANLFKTLSLNVKMAVLPFEQAVFS